MPLLSLEHIQQWVILTDPEQELQRLLADTGLPLSGVNGGLGWVYVDYTQGLCLGLTELLQLAADGQILARNAVSDQPDRHLSLRFEACLTLDVHPLSAEGCQQLGLPGQPAWLTYYESPADAGWMLAEEALHPFRIGDFPYDLRFRLAGEGFQQEEALGRFVQRIPGAELALAVELLSEPRQGFGVHRGDFLPLVMTPFDGEDLLFWLPRLGTLALQTSP